MRREREENYTDRNRFTRTCIGDALLALMKEKEMEKISVANIVRRAGISRMTYYHYYQSKTEVLQDYMDEIIRLFLEESHQKPEVGSFHDKTHILFALQFFDRYAEFFLLLVRTNLYSLIIDAINEFMCRHVYGVHSGSIYELYYYAGALLNTFIKWEENGKKETAEEIAELVTRHLETKVK